MMQQVAAQNTDIAAFGTTKSSAAQVKDNASEAFNKVFNDENWYDAKPVSAVSRTDSDNLKITRADNSRQGDIAEKASDGKVSESVQHAAEKETACESARCSQQVKSESKESLQQSTASDRGSVVPPSEEDSADDEILLPESQSHNQLMDFIAKLQSKEMQYAESLVLLQSSEETSQLIPESSLSSLLEELKLSLSAEDDGSPVTEKPDDNLLTQLLAMLKDTQAGYNSEEPGIDQVLNSEAPETSQADLELLSILLLPVSAEQAGSELLSETDLVAEQLQLDISLGDGKIGSDKQTFAVSPQLNHAETELPESLTDTSIKTQLELAVLGSVNKQADDKALKPLLSVSENKLEQVLTNLAQRIAKLQGPAESVISEATLNTEQDKQLFVADFVSALKAGIDEFKQQVKQGREPGIDLKAMIAEALGKVNDASGDTIKNPLKLEQVEKSFSQVLEAGLNIQSTLEQQISALNLHERQARGESNQLHVETAKSQLLQQTQHSQFDKAVNINKPEGHQQLAEKVQWMVNQKNMLAEIRLDPAELGSMSVKVNIQGDAASVSFVVQTQHARDALEQAVPRLREMLAEKGIALGQSSVQQEHKNKQDGDGSQAGGQFAAEEDDLQGDEQSSVISQRITNGALGGIDYFV